MTEPYKVVWLDYGKSWFEARLTGNATSEKYRHDAEVQRLVAEARAGSVFVKPLVWEEPRWGNAYSKCGLYKAHKEYGSTTYYVTWGRLILRDDMGRTNWFSSLDAAKAAAQADYERRILSALSNAPTRQVTPQEAAKVLLEADDYMPTTAKLAATKAHLGRDSKVQPVAIAEAWRAALRSIANGGDD